jgi:hypothetical protein
MGTRVRSAVRTSKCRAVIGITRYIGSTGKALKANPVSMVCHELHSSPVGAAAVASLRLRLSEDH